MKKIGFIGLGKLGMPCAEELAKVHSVAGYDIYPRESNSVAVLSSIEEVAQHSEVIFVAVPTPHEQEYDGSVPSCHLAKKDFDYSAVKQVLEELNRCCNKNHLVVLISTVLPGTTRMQLIQRARNYRFIYNPYLIAMGSVRYDMVNPEMVIIGTKEGETSADAAMLIDEVYGPIMQNNPRYVVGTWDEAESIKIFYNTFISAKLSLVNMIQDVAIRNGNINVDVVTKALAESDYRIMGPKYMIAGMGDAGACHPRDNIALRYMSDRLGLNYDLFESIMQARELQAKNLARFIVDIAKSTNLPVYIHGKAYKPGIDLVDGSYSLLVGHYISEFGLIPEYIDPLTESTTPESITGVVLLAHNAVVTYDGREEQATYCHFNTGSVIIDPWRNFASLDSGVEVIHYGNTRGMNGNQL
jgi:UDPglucose 6-dehydrogenase